MARPSRKTEIKEKLFNAAFELIAQGGFQQSPMSKLAKLAGVSVGSIYVYFESKDALVMELFEHVREQMEQAILLNYVPEADMYERFRVLFLNICDYYRSHSHHFIFMDQFALSSYNKSGLDAFSKRMQTVYMDFYKEGIQRGVLRKIRLENAMSLTHGPIVSLLKKHNQGTPISTDTIVELMECVWRGLQPESKASGRVA